MDRGNGEMKSSHSCSPTSQPLVASHHLSLAGVSETLPWSANAAVASTTSTSSSVREGGDGYTWRIDLFKTEPFWRGWFTDMSSLFLSVPEPKLLLVAGVERLDKDLTIGQMQGT